MDTLELTENMLKVSYKSVHYDMDEKIVTLYCEECDREEPTEMRCSICNGACVLSLSIYGVVSKQ